MPSRFWQHFIGNGGRDEPTEPARPVNPPDNDDSIRVLKKLGFQFEAFIAMSADGLPTRLFAREL